MKESIVVLIMLCLGLAVWAFPPVVVLGIDGAAAVGSADSVGYYTIGTSVFADYRTVLDDFGYFGAWLDAKLDWHVLALPLADDHEAIGFLAGITTSIVELEAGSQLIASTGVLSGSSGGVGNGEIEWHALAEIPFGDNRASAGVSYVGNISYDAGAVSDRSRHSGMLFFEHSPSLSLGYLLALDGAVELYTEQPILDVAGAPTPVNRNDYVVGLATELDGLIGYFTTWNLRLEGGARLSNANRYIGLTTTVEADSEDRYFGRFAGSIESSPVREWGLNAIVVVDGATYLKREAFNDGAPTGQLAQFLSSSIDGGAEWSPDGHLYVSLIGSGNLSISNDAEFDGWSVLLTAGVGCRL